MLREGTPAVGCLKRCVTPDDDVKLQRGLKWSGGWSNFCQLLCSPAQQLVTWISIKESFLLAVTSLCVRKQHCVCVGCLCVVFTCPVFSLSHRVLAGR